MTKNTDTVIDITDEAITPARKTRGRAPKEQAVAPVPQLKPEALQELEQDAGFATRVDAAVQSIAAQQFEAARAIGQMQVLDTLNKYTGVGFTLLMQRMKESKAYKGLNIPMPDGSITVINTFEDFCKHMGTSYSKVAEDLQNLSLFGEEFMEMSERIRLSYKDIRKLRNIPDEDRALMFKEDGKTIRTDDPEVLKEWIEDILAKKAREKAEQDEKEANAKALEKMLEKKDKALNEAQTALTKFKMMTPDARMELMAVKEAKGREILAEQGAEVLALFGKFLATAMGMQSMEGVSPAVASQAHAGVSSLCESFAGLLAEYAFEVDFRGMVFPEWMEQAAIWNRREAQTPDNGN